jgi:hypothetical protein
MRGRIVAGRDGRYVDADAAALELLGLSLEELCCMQVGDLSGPHAELARTVWRRLAATGEDMSSGEGTLYLRNATEVRVRYVRIAALPNGDYELVMEPIGADGANLPPTSDRPSSILREWRAAEREAEAAAAAAAAAVAAASAKRRRTAANVGSDDARVGPNDATDAADKLRRLYQDSVVARTRSGSDHS